jgi:hypothetical protein
MPLVIAGQGSLDSYLSKLVVTDQNLIFLGPLPYEDMILVASKSRALVAFYDPKKLENRITASNKFSESIQLHKFIIVNNGTNLEGLVREYKNGWVVTYVDCNELESLLLKKPWVDSKPIENPQAEILRASWKDQVLKFQSYFRRLVQKNA